MEPTTSVESLLLNNLVELTDHNLQRLRDLESKEFPFSVAHDLLDLLKTIMGSIMETLLTLKMEINDLPDSEAFSRIESYGQLLAVLHLFFQPIEAMQRTNIPQAYVYLLSHASESFDHASKFVVIPEYDFNYSYQNVMTDLKGILEDAITDSQKLFPKETSNLVVISFPYAYRQNVIANSLLAHEIGHFLVESEGMTDKIEEKIVLEKEKVSALSKETSEVQLGERDKATLTYLFSLQKIEADTYDRVVKQTKSWISEIMSDLIGFKLFGPVFMFSLMDFLLIGQNIDDVSEDYPPAHMRIGVLLKEYKDSGYSNLLSKESDVLKSEFLKHVAILEEFVTTKSVPSQDLQTQLLEETTQKLVPDMQLAVQKRLEKSFYRPEQFSKEAFILSNIMETLIPPAELQPGVPADPISIMNAGLIFQLLKFESVCDRLNMKDDESKLKLRRKIELLVLKSIESSTIERLMKNALGRIKGESK